jgi:hypothetical protein
MVMALVAALAAVLPGQLDPAPLDPVHGANRRTVGPDHFHMFLDAVHSCHELFLWAVAVLLEHLTRPMARGSKAGTGP